MYLTLGVSGLAKYCSQYQYSDIGQYYEAVNTTNV